MSLGPAEILVILVVALIVFGPHRLPEVGRQVGSTMRELRRMQASVKSELDGVMHGFDDHETPVQRGVPARREPDHTQVDQTPPAADPTGAGTTELPPVDAESPDETDDGFAGPGGSFI